MKRISVLRKDGSNYALDNSDGIADFVVAGFDRWNRRQLNPLVVTGGFGGANSSTDHRSPSGNLRNLERFPTERRRESRGKLCDMKTRSKAKGNK